jgi:hypothetical protein
MQKEKRGHFWQIQNMRKTKNENLFPEDTLWLRLKMQYAAGIKLKCNFCKL